MRLERLEIHGFKSFSDRSELAFDKGVTAIVGPNGCGKSNVADAITWVMGEQSAKSLRGDRMEDVIFSGSDARKPTAAAEVRLRFTGVLKAVTGPAFPAENGDGKTHGNGNGNGNGTANGNGQGYSNGNGANGHGHGNGNGHHAAPLGDLPAATHETIDELIQSVAREVEVTRRLYRSGESEYLIDGEVCRLKDIHDLLMDTGLGSKAYAIIEQGKIGMILSSRPTDRRQLIEEAAGVTKYKARRRAAELKLEAARQNLTRIDDIVFEVEKQRGTLKRQAAKARRYQRLRDELRRWEKVLFARRYRQLAETIESTRMRLADAREREAIAAAQLAAVQDALDRGRLALSTSESQLTDVREAVHASELGITRQQQQLTFEREQHQACEHRTRVVTDELFVVDSRREPTQARLTERRDAARAAGEERDHAAATLAAEADAFNVAHREIEGLEADVEAARSEVFSAINSATALRHALEHAAAARERVAETLSKLDVESDDVRVQVAHVEANRSATADQLSKTHAAIESTRAARAARESELTSARIELEWRTRSVRAREHELAGLDARLQSLEELEAARAGYGDAPRTVLAQANGRVNQQGALADYLEVETGYERAVEGWLGDLLQHVIVRHPEDAQAGFDVLREAGAGRCGFLIAPDGDTIPAADAALDRGAPGEGLLALSSVVRVTGPYSAAILDAIGDGCLAESPARARSMSASTSRPVVTTDGDVFRGRLAVGGGRADARGILETKREVKELRERIRAERESLAALVAETAEFDGTVALASNAIAALNAELHKLEKAVVAHDAQLRHATDEASRLSQKSEQLARERRQLTDEREALSRREDEARRSIDHLAGEQRDAEDRLTAAQRRLLEAREATDELSRRAAEAGAAHAALVERSAALAADVRRLEDAAAELEQRALALRTELDDGCRRAGELREVIAAGEARLETETATLEEQRARLREADDQVADLRSKVDELDTNIKIARVGLEHERSLVAEHDIARATAEADLSHLASSCLESVQATLDEVRDEVEQLERDGALESARHTVAGDETDDSGDEVDSSAAAEPSDDPLSAEGPSEATVLSVTAEEAIASLRGKIDRLGPVNMMAIEQFDELEGRHSFLTTERKDLVDSIAQTNDAIKRIDETTQQRFADAFNAINRNFQEMFGTLFGGGRAGLTLLDESDPLESGIEIIAQPPGKRLQNVQLLSGGEKALTAISLMFAMFKYRPSPFCLLDEIDAPLDDANIGRFVEMLRGMQQHTQFIVITHNRKTMEIADRLYGVTMEEPGVSKLISVQLH
jgi:chromosome segregation protein